MPLESILEVGIASFYLDVNSGVPREVAIDLRNKWLDDLASHQGVPLDRIGEARDRFTAFLAPSKEEAP